MDVREKLVELLDEAEEWADHKCDELDCEKCPADKMKGNCVQQLMVDRLIAHGVTVQEWIPASSPPQKAGEYIVKIREGEIATTLFYSISGKGWFELDDDEHEIPYNVTHWMPLPQPPKGE